MKFNLLLIIPLLALLSCQSSIELNKYNFDSVKEYAIDCIKRNDSIAFMKLFDFEAEKIKSEFSTQDQIQSTKRFVLKQFAEANSIFKDSDLEYLKYDFLDAIEGGELIDDNSFNIYLKSNENYYKLRFITIDGDLKDANSFYFFMISNLSSECRKFSTKPYNPNALSTHELMWDDLGKKTFNYVALNLYNLTIYPVEKVKYRITITRNSDDMLIFMKTLESKVNINEGDVGAMVIDGLKGVYLGAKLDSENSFSWEVEVLEVYPKPLKNPCEKIGILQQFE